MTEPERTSPQRGSTLGLLPLPEKRRRRLLPLFVVGVVLLIIGTVIDIGFVWGLGVGLLVSTAIAWWLDRVVRRRSER